MTMNDDCVLPVCGFPGIGKSHLCSLTGWSDSDSSSFSWQSEGVRHPDWPANYIEHLRGLSGIVMVSTHSDVRQQLHESGIPFVLCYPHRSCKGEYLARYARRGSPEKFISLVDKMWDTWLDEMEGETRAVRHVVLQPGQYAGDIDWSGIRQSL